MSFDRKREKTEYGSVLVEEAGVGSSLVIREGRMTLTPADAAQILAQCAYSGQRPIGRPHVSVLKAAMEQGQFSAGSQLHFCRLGRDLILVNGHHRLTALSQCTAALEFQILITDVQDEAGIAVEYYRHDTVEKPRTLADVVRASGVAEANDLAPTQARIILTAVKVISSGFAKNTAQHADSMPLRIPDRMLAAASPWWRWGKEYYALLEGANPAIKVAMKRQYVMAVALVTLKYQNARAVEFWGGLAADDGLRKGDPRKTALTFLLASEVHNKTLSSWMQGAGMSLAWNHWFAGNTVTFLRTASVDKIELRGTPIGRNKKG